jgi:hypothetical protein
MAPEQIYLVQSSFAQISPIRASIAGMGGNSIAAASCADFVRYKNKPAA